MATIVDFFGAHGLTLSATPGAAFSWYTAGAAANLTIDATGGRSSHPAVKIKQSAAGSSIIGFDVAAGNRKVVLFGWFKINQLPTLASAVLLQGVGPATNPGIQLTTAGVLRAFAGANFQNYSGTFTTGRWYFISALIDCSVSPFSVAWKVYDETAGTNTAQTTCSTAGGDTAADITGVRFGQNAAACQLGDATHDGGWFADVGLSLTSADHPIAPCETSKLIPAGIGTHSVGTGSFTKTGSVAVTGADTNSYLEIDEQAPSATDWVAQTAIDAAAFLEYTLAWSAAETRNPMALKFYTDHQGAATGAYTGEVRVRENATDSADVLSGGTKSATTVVKRALVLANRLGGAGAWTNATALAARIRFGYSGDATPDFQLNAVFGEALIPINLGTIVPQAVTVTSGNTTTVTKKPGLVRAASAGSTPTVTAARQRVLAITASAASAASVLKIPKLVRAVSAASTSTVAAARQRVVAATASAASSASVLTSKLRLNLASITNAATATVTRKPLKTVSTGQASTSTVTKSPALVRSVTGSSSATVTKRPNLVRAVAAGSTVTVAAIRAVLLAVTRTATSAATLIKQPQLVRTASAGSTSTVQALRQRVKSVVATATSTATVTKAAQLVRAVSAASSATVTRRPGLVRSTTAPSTTTVTRRPSITRTVAAASSSSVRFAASKIITATATATALVGFGAQLAITAAAGSAVSVARGAQITVTATATSVVSVVTAILTAIGIIGRKGSSNRTVARDQAPSVLNAVSANPGEGRTRATSDRTGEVGYAPATSDGIIEGGDG